MPLTCRVCGVRVKPANWSRICDKCWPDYERERNRQKRAKARARRELRRTLRILTPK